MGSSKMVNWITLHHCCASLMKIQCNSLCKTTKQIIDELSQRRGTLSRPQKDYSSGKNRYPCSFKFQNQVNIYNLVIQLNIHIE
ncbi:hypothetical protein DsansV1_C13g0122131 [Dioscorea sansibarensis]